MTEASSSASSSAGISWYDVGKVAVDGAIADLDKPLYRIFPLWLFEAALTVNAGNLALVPPRWWDDPYEDPCAKVVMQTHGQAKPKQLTLAPVYAQCWSFEGASDALLRAYSRVTKPPKGYPIRRNLEPGYEGVQVTTTPRKLVAALNALLKKREDHARTTASVARLRAAPGRFSMTNCWPSRSDRGCPTRRAT